MRALIQRVSWAEVEVEGKIVGQIKKGLLAYIAVAVGDTDQDARYLADKIATLRIFPDSEGKLNRSLQDARGGVLGISNFTLLADARKGRRPALEGAAPSAMAQPLHETFLGALRQRGIPLACGVFGAEMAIRSVADGPVNILLDSPGAKAPVSESSSREP